jgi:fatty-acyl-CoA synthase
MRPSTLTEMLETAAERRPTGPALIGPRGRLAWFHFAAAARRVAEGLARRGIAPGDRVALWLPNRPEYLILQFALARLGATAVHVNTRFRAHEVAYLIGRARPAAIATCWGFEPADFPAILAELAPDLRAPLRFVIGIDAGGAKEIGPLPVLPWEQLDGAPERRQDDAAPDAFCLTYTTSGTTAGPKLVVHRQAAIAGHAFDVAERIGLDAPKAALLGAVPFCGTYGMTAAMAAIAGGAPVVCMDRFEAEPADALIRLHGVTHMVATDDLVLQLAAAAGERPYAPFACTALADFHGKASLALEASDRLNLACRGAYGSSEMQALLALQDPGDLARRGGGGGTLVSAAAAVRARDPASGEIAAEGELEFRAPSMFAGYLGDEAATAAVLTEDLFYRSGDLGLLREEGGFDFRTRLGDALRLGGFLVHPEEIEGFFLAQPGVAAAQVVAVGDRPVAFLTGEGIEEAALLAAAEGAMARHKLPARVVALDAFPMAESPNGLKVQRARLREMAEALLAESAAEPVLPPVSGA